MHSTLLFETILHYARDEVEVYRALVLKVSSGATPVLKTVNRIFRNVTFKEPS